MSSRALLQASAGLLGVALAILAVASGATPLHGAEPLRLEAPPALLAPGELPAPMEELAPAPLPVLPPAAEEPPLPGVAPRPDLAPLPDQRPGYPTESTIAPVPLSAADGWTPDAYDNATTHHGHNSGPVQNWSVGETYPGNVRYWIVSSRNAPQDLRRIQCGHLDVFERHCDGRLCRSSVPQLVAGLHPGAPILLSLHGSYVAWEDNLVQSEGTWRWIRSACPHLPLNIIFFTWPSDQERCLLAPCELKRHGVEAEYNAFYVAALLSSLPDCHPVCLLGHSYGARMTMATLHLAGGGAIHGAKLGRGVGSKRLRAVLAAGALDHNWLNADGRYGCALCRAECVLNLRNRHDLVLKVYPLLRPLMARRAIGASGVTGLDRHQQDCTCRLHDLDVTGLVPAGHFWPNYYKQPQLARILASWVYFPDVNTGYIATSPALTPSLAPQASLPPSMPPTPPPALPQPVTSQSQPAQTASRGPRVTILQRNR